MMRAAQTESLVRVAIIGTAGRKDDAAKMNKVVFTAMVNHAREVIRDVWKLPHERVILVSGGAAWADHVAVALWLEERQNPHGHPFAGLHLFLPCAFQLTDAQAQAVDTGSSDWRLNCGRLVNQLHREFSKKLGRDSLHDLYLAQSLGAILDMTGNGFHARNKLVAAAANRLLAFTWGDDPTQPKDGGTLHTWNLCKCSARIHVPLGNLSMNTQTPTKAKSTTPVSQPGNTSSQ